jgi:hypothetical protein
MKTFMLFAERFSNKRTYFFLLTAAFIFLSSSVFAQWKPVDSLLFALRQKPKIFFQLDASNSFISGRGANAIGFKAGLDFGRRVKFGAAYYTLVSDIVEKKYVAKYDTFYNAKLQMSYYTTFAEYVVYDRGRWQFSLGNQFGVGRAYFWYYPNRESKSKTETLSDNLIILYEPYISGQFKILKWFGLGFGTSYRTMLVTNKEIDHKLSSPVYSIRIKIFLNEIYGSLFPRGIFPKKETAAHK